MLPAKKLFLGFVSHRIWLSKGKEKDCMHTCKSAVVCVCIWCVCVCVGGDLKRDRAGKASPKQGRKNIFTFIFGFPGLVYYVSNREETTFNMEVVGRQNKIFKC